MPDPAADDELDLEDTRPGSRRRGSASGPKAPGAGDDPDDTAVGSRHADHARGVEAHEADDDTRRGAGRASRLPQADDIRRVDRARPDDGVPRRAVRAEGGAAGGIPSPGTPPAGRVATDGAPSQAIYRPRPVEPAQVRRQQPAPRPPQAPPASPVRAHRSRTASVVVLAAAVVLVALVAGALLVFAAL